MSENNYLLKESITESVVRLYEASGGEVHEMHYLQQEGDDAPILKPYVIQ
jgi:hypothetical protein